MKVKNTRMKLLLYPETKFGGFADTDGTILFYQRVTSLLSKQSVLVDFGCGRGAHQEDTIAVRRDLRNFKGKVGRVIGVDVDPASMNNPFIDEFHLINNDKIPLENGTVDICVCDNVVEHLSDPDFLFQELARLLKPGGYLCLRTPNRWGYVGLFSSMVPNYLHAKFLSIAQKDRKSEDVFPTYYNCNSLSKLRSQLLRNGMSGCVYGFEGPPAYFDFSDLFYFFGYIYQKIAPSVVRNTIFLFAQKEH